MTERTRVFALIAILVVACAVTAGTSMLLLYRVEYEENRRRLVVTVQSQARLIEAVARFDAVHSKGYPGGPLAATLSQIVDAHQRYEEHGQTVEFTLARREGDSMVFLLVHHHAGVKPHGPIPFDSSLAEPMRRALSGLSGTMVGLDYRGETVLAAHEPVAELDLGIVAKIDVAEIRAPFVNAALITAAVTIVIALVGTVMFLRISDPMVKRLRETARDLEEHVAERTRELVEANEAIERQSAALRELSTPVITLWDQVVLLPLVGVLDKLRMVQVMESLLGAITRTESRVAILDVTGVPDIDAEVARSLVRTVAAAEMLGAEVVLTGISPDAAQALAQPEMDVPRLRTRGTLQAGLEEAFAVVHQQVVSTGGGVQ